MDAVTTQPIRVRDVLVGIHRQYAPGTRAILAPRSMAVDAANPYLDALRVLDDHATAIDISYRDPMGRGVRAWVHVVPLETILAGERVIVQNASGGWTLADVH